jgi:hypothetical protein
MKRDDKTKEESRETKNYCKLSAGSQLRLKMIEIFRLRGLQLSKSCGRSLKERSLTFKKRISKNDSSNGKCDLALSNQTPQLHIKTIKLLKSGTND